MPFHFCWDEAQVLLMSMPFVGFSLVWLRSKFPKKTHAHKDHNRCC